MQTLDCLLDYIPIPIYVKDENFLYTYVNKAFCDLSGVAREKILGKTVFDIAPYEFAMEYDKADRELMTAKGVQSYQTDVRSADRTDRAINFYKAAIKSGDSAPPGIIGAMFDVTERKLAEKRLMESEEKYRAIVENTRDPVYIYEDDSIVYANSPACELLEMDVEEVCSKTMYDFFHPGDVERMKEYAENRSKGLAVAKPFEARLLTKSGREKICEFYSSAVRINGVPAVLGTIRDITEWRAYEKSMVEAKEASEEASNAKSRFLANMSHEIRTPMNGIIGMTELLALTGLNAEQKDMVNIIKSCARSLLGIINDILDMSKIEMGKLEIHKTGFNLSEMIKNIAGIVKVLCDQKNLKFELVIGGNIPEHVIGDELRLKQILLNLSGNAVKFTETGCVSLEADMQKGSGNNIEVVFSVRDTGIGIKKEDIPKLFTYFSQLDGSLSKRFQGTGLGLAISQRLVELMDGEIKVESEYGTGSVFRFTIPFDLP